MANSDAADPVIARAAALRGRLWPARLLAASPLTCPTCGRTVLGLASTAGMDPADPLSVASARWPLHPCGCAVDRFWAVAADREIAARGAAVVAGDTAPAPPGRVAAVAEQLRRLRLADATARLRALYTLREAALVTGMGGARAGHEREICALLSDLAAVLPPGVGVEGLPPISLALEVSVWAAQRGLRLPRGSRPGDRPEPPAALVLSWDAVRQAVVADPDAPPVGRHPAEVERLSDAAFGEIRLFVESGRPPSEGTLALLARVGAAGGCDGLLDRLFVPPAVPQAAEGPAVDADPDAGFAASLATRCRRRLERRSQQPPPPSQPLPPSG